MVGGLTFEVVSGHPMVLRPVGVLTAVTGPQLRNALLSCLADQPAALVVDASSLALGGQADDEIGLLPLGSVARESQRWPGTRIAVAAAVELQRAAARLGIQDAVAWCPDEATAVTEVGEVPVPPTARRRIVPDRDAPAPRCRSSASARGSVATGTPPNWSLRSSSPTRSCTRAPPSTSRCGWWARRCTSRFAMEGRVAHTWPMLTNQPKADEG
jgi:hypothetical protein